MKVIELLTKIANGEEVPLEIKCYNKKYRYDSLSNDYEQIGGFSSLFKDLLILNGFDNLPKCLNDEVEIIEEDKKIRKIKVNYSPDIEEKIFYEDGDKPNHCILGDAGTELLINKINEIIDYIMEEK